MNLKLTIQNAEAMRHLFETEVLQMKPADMAESLLRDLMIKIYRKLRDKLEARIKGNGYSISLTDIEAKAFYVFFQNRSFGEGWEYEEVVIARQIAAIDKQYA